MKTRTVLIATCGPIYTHDSEAQTVMKNFEAAIPNIPGKSLIAL
jgi:hypothetical protein